MFSPRRTLLAAACLTTLVVKADQCIQYNGTTCAACAAGTYLDHGACYPCRDRCKECIDGEQCTVCKKRSAVYDGQFCYDCPEGCTYCFNNQTCVTCELFKHFNGVRCVGLFGPNAATTVGVMGAVSVLLAAALAVVV
ncbi:hypothetical protein, conserved [Angomonas deanei]|uniref:Uncharacterized protein n=1 Tax=Angomonas deanei TaxID=59799 RepID=A0A7G2CME3_9TRYP|nr:hypothetical protein, conserved [Angomonas deanei]